MLRNSSTILRIYGINDISDLNGIRKALVNGVEVNASDSEGRTLLIEAVIRGCHEIMTFLLSRGADANFRDAKTWTALHFAVQNFDILAVEILVANGAEINAQDEFGNSVIWRAVFNSKGRGDVLIYLVRNGADVTLKNKSGTSALDLANRISNYEIAPFLSPIA